MLTNCWQLLVDSPKLWLVPNKQGYNLTHKTKFVKINFDWLSGAYMNSGTDFCWGSSDVCYRSTKLKHLNPNPTRWWWGRCERRKEGVEKKMHLCGGRGSNPGPTACWGRVSSTTPQCLFCKYAFPWLFADRVHVRLSPLSSKLVHAFSVIYKPLNKLNTVQGLWHIIFWNRCMCQGVNQYLMVTSVHFISE